MERAEDKQYKMQGRVAIRRIGSDTFLVPVSGLAAGGRVFPLNESAECIWECLSQGGTPSSAAERVVARFEVDKDTALADCVACAEELLEQKLLEEVS